MGHTAALVVVGIATSCALVATVSNQLHDSNFVFLWEATGLLAGDHPYRDFFEWGAPLGAYLSAGLQWLVGYRLIGEFLIHWSFIVAGVVLAFHLGIRSSGSTVAAMLPLPLVLTLIAMTPTYHYPKLFTIPLGIWVAWRYLDRPTRPRAAVLGVAVAIAFLLRHDCGVYVGVAGALSLVLAATPQPGNRRLVSRVQHAAVSGATAAVLLMPWAVAVQSNEGLLSYSRLRASKFEGSFAQAYRSLGDVSLLRAVTPDRPQPLPGMIEFAWQPGIDEARRRRLEQEYRLQVSPTRDTNRLQFQVPDIYDPKLLDLDPYIHDPAGFEWERLRAIRLGLPAADDCVMVLQEVTVLMPLALLAVAVYSTWRGRTVGADTAGARQMALAAVVIMLVNASLLRMPSYVLAILPVAAPLSAPLLAWSYREWRLVTIARVVAVVAVLAVCAFAALVWAGPLTSGVRSMAEWRQEWSELMVRTYSRLTAYPPVDASAAPRLAYLRECTVPGDRVLVTGMTPFDVTYLVERPVAGGHLYWKDAWGADPIHEAQSLALIERQSVPFAVANRRPVLEDFAPYPRIQAYLKQYYAPLPGSEGYILFDRRRQVLRPYGPNAMPCFAPAPSNSTESSN